MPILPIRGIIHTCRHVEFARKTRYVKGGNPDSREQLIKKEREALRNKFYGPGGVPQQSEKSEAAINLMVNMIINEEPEAKAVVGIVLRSIVCGGDDLSLDLVYSVKDKIAERKKNQ